MHNSSCTCNNYSMIISILSELITVAEFSFGVDTVDAQEFEFHSSVPTVVCNEYPLSEFCTKQAREP